MYTFRQGAPGKRGPPGPVTYFPAPQVSQQPLSSMHVQLYSDVLVLNFL